MIEWQLRNGAERLLPASRRWAKLTRTDLLRGMAKLVLQQSKQRFGKRTSPDGHPWAPRTVSYPWPPLRKTGAMFRALRMTPPIDGEARAGIWPSSGKALLAHWHQKGTKRNGRPYMPARPFVGVGRQDEQQLESLIDKFVQARFA